MRLESLRSNHGEDTSPEHPAPRPRLARDRQRLLGCLLSGSMIGAPFLALLYDATAGLAVATIALAATAFLAWDGARIAIGSGRTRLRLAAAINVFLAAACLGIAMMIVNR